MQWFRRHLNELKRPRKCSVCLSDSPFAEFFPFFFVFLVYQRGSLLVYFSSSSFRVACPCLKSRQVVLGCAHRHTYNTSHKKALQNPATATTRPLGNISWSASFLLVSLQWHSGNSPCCRATADKATPNSRKQRQRRQVMDGTDVSWRSAKAKTAKSVFFYEQSMTTERNMCHT